MIPMANSLAHNLRPSAFSPGGLPQMLLPFVRACHPRIQQSLPNSDIYKGLPTICSFGCTQILETRYPSKQPDFSAVFLCPLFVVVFSRRKLPCGHVALVAWCKRLAIRNTWMNRDELKRRILPSLINMACACLRSTVNFPFFGHCEDIKAKTSGHVSFHYIPHKILPKMKGIKFQWEDCQTIKSSNYQPKLGIIRYIIKHHQAISSIIHTSNSVLGLPQELRLALDSWRQVACSANDVNQSFQKKHVQEK